MADQVQESTVVPPRDDDTLAKAHTYTFLRTAMVGLLVGLGVAVFYETWRQGSFLTSVSAYYYTPAQAIFVGALVALGACMIALRGTNIVEEVFLNLGGMFAVLVAIVPTSRGKDHDSAVNACNRAAESVPTNVDCPSVQELVDATRANVDNNMVAVLVLGALGLVAATLYAWRDARKESRGLTAGFLWGLAAALAVWVGALVALVRSIDWFVANAHPIAAICLFGCIFVVAVANAVRRDREQDRRPQPPANARGMARGVLVRDPKKLDRYAVLAWAMVGAAALGILLLYFGMISLFLLEITVALLFALFWMVQTIERLR